MRTTQSFTRKHRTIVMAAAGSLAVVLAVLSGNLPALRGQLDDAPVCPEGTNFVRLAYSGQRGVSVSDDSRPVKPVSQDRSIVCPSGTVATGVYYGTLRSHPDLPWQDATSGLGLRCAAAEDIANRSASFVIVDTDPAGRPIHFHEGANLVEVSCPAGHAVKTVHWSDVLRSDQPDAMDGVGITCEELSIDGPTSTTVSRIPSDMKADGKNGKVRDIWSIACPDTNLVSGIRFDYLSATESDPTQRVDSVANVFCARMLQNGCFAGASR